MSSRVFVDTNVLVYRRDASETAKQPLADAWIKALWIHRAGRLSLQVLQEYYQTVTRKLKPGLSREDARAELRDFVPWHPLPVTVDTLALGFEVEDRFQLSFWDSLVVASAKQASCTYLLTEDLQDGQDLDGLQVVNPFARYPEELGFAA